MKNLLVWGAVSIWMAIGGGALHAQSQKPIVGERAPELKISEWIVGAQPQSGKPQLIEFFHSSNPLSEDHLKTLDAWAVEYRNRISVIVVAREPKDKISSIFGSKSFAFAVGIDDNGKTFAAYNVQFVPFSVVVDAKGRLRWFGNSSDLTEAIINDTL